LVADTVSGFKTSEQSSSRQRPKFRQEFSKFGAQEPQVILWGPQIQFQPILTTAF